MTTTPEPKTRTTRGSVKRVLVFCLIGGILGATAGFFLAAKPDYKSVGLI